MMRNGPATLLLITLLAPTIVPSTSLEAVGATLLYRYHVGSTVSAETRVKDIYGKVHTFQDFRGKTVFFHFWSTRCPVAKTYEPKFIDLQEEFGGKGVVQVAVIADRRELKGDYANLRDYVAKAGLNFLVTVDPGNKISDLFGVQVAPHCFVIDKGGVLRYSGSFDDDPDGNKGADAKPYVRDAIVALLEGRPVPVTRTAPYGCGIKPPD